MTNAESMCDLGRDANPADVIRDIFESWGFTVIEADFERAKKVLAEPMRWYSGLDADGWE